MIKMQPLEWYLKRYGDNLDTRLTYYHTYLARTDYVAAKLAEAAYLGLPVEEKYKAILEQRAKARAEIEKIGGSDK